MGKLREEYERLYKSSNEKFNGMSQSKKKTEQYQRLCTSAKKLRAEHYEQIELIIQDTESNHRNAAVNVDFESPLVLSGVNQRFSLAELLLNADDVTIAANEVKMRLSFGVEDIWK